ncbi:hypothetical protein COW80_01690 [Candidatus Beckwithbacteria bacterium CG22_combo_CG10-13_8_21_14_all_01_47_9]|uniref:UDP-N-acetylenolpyruvoylglucosamine reductase n=5 Tax=Candidatus Beckwithiibacteriota TaxID=1752726 RepID=A0A2H0E191_9BACT|nr:MAG: hypothetical protein AUJ59_03045 [Candidatus Beckwithbacteria bacterium CG1_02_47_37]PIP52338.1 MAG: hypothetical protein COX09_02140 [Candidatus Beckwithbacteria bacterium CG23_combo_of_CG06-09_8_20_14_all_47_9]PIP88194.1 MAG: hypothetical protein COW80_01690 [Candidatus Beckwithbacteria bacterium CG22_combo_CG10-13_8_21_14_all_01_47_9]PJA21514.1 MAG: hypothetical protein COX59_04185 [Candidatus Beckwithbacteria bacterium CG_4_10_14_0_2_um_filter_47_25]PJC65988.1 MAG: hypothetical prot
MKILNNISLVQYSTFRIGGSAEYFIEVKNQAELIEAVAWAKARRLPIYILGNGSNTLIADAGIKGLVIRNLTGEIKVLDSIQAFSNKKIPPRFQLVEPDPELTNLTYDESQFPPVLVTLDSGVYLPKAIFQLIAQGITGLEWFAGIPATAGGATYINLHGANKFWSDYLIEAEILDPAGQIKTTAADDFHYDYDQSVLKDSGDLVLAVTLRLRRGPKEQALKIAKYRQLKKAHQPQRSLGCVFQNLSAAEQKRLYLPTPSIGYLIDKKLNLKGTKIGGAWIPEKHAGFVENLGGATAADVLQLIELVKKRAKQQLDLDLKLEIVLWLN